VHGELAHLGAPAHAAAAAAAAAAAGHHASAATGCTNAPSLVVIIIVIPQRIITSLQRYSASHLLHAHCPFFLHRSFSAFHLLVFGSVR